MPRRQSLRDRKSLTAPSSPPTPPIATTRPRRTAAPSSTVLTRDLSDDDEDINNGDIVTVDEPRQTLRLTVKMPSSRLREATSAATQDAAPVASTRSTRNIKKSYVVETSSEDEEEEEDYADDEIAEEATPNPEQGEDDEDDKEVEEDDAEAEMDADIDADGDIEMDDDADDGVPLGKHPPPPILKVNPPAAPKGKPVLTVKPAQSTKLPSVEAKEVSMDEGSDDDEELSELGSDDEDEEEPADEDEDAEGEDVDDDDDDDEEELAEGDDSRSPDALSRGTTPDINKMTKRQRSRLNEVFTASSSSPLSSSTPNPAGISASSLRGSDFLELPMEPQVKKHLTAEEHAMRRAEMARRRKNLSEKRNEEEKQETINRLLKKQAPKRRGKISAREIEAQDRGDMSEAEEREMLAMLKEREMLEKGVGEVEKANPVFVRWVSGREGRRVGVPEEWLGGPMGEVFTPASADADATAGRLGGVGKMVVEVVEG